MSDFLSQVRALREKSDDSQHSPSLTSLAEQGDIEGVKRVLSEGKAEVNAKDSDGWPPLVAAARDGKIEVVKCLIQEAEAEVDVRNDDEYTAMIAAAEEGHFEVVQYLVEWNADVNARDMYGDTALIYAARIKPHINVCKYLVQEAGLGAVLVKGSKGLDSLHWCKAVGGGNIGYLLEQKEKYLMSIATRDLSELKMLLPSIQEAMDLKDHEHIKQESIL